MNNNDHRKYATFFISTGRCATQWFSKSLATNYQDLAIVRHEPLQMEYRTRYFFRSYNKGEKVEFSQAIKNHLTFVSNTIERFHYIEVGWPVYGVLPFILSQLEGYVKVVHLYRHPIRVASSLATHKVYGRTEWTDTLAISPYDGVAQSYLAGERWNSMSEFEKCLFWWTEVNDFALKLSRTFKSVPWLCLKYENVFSEDGGSELARLLTFLSLPVRDRFLNARTKTIDEYSRQTEKTINISALKKYPKAFEVMDKLHYEYDDLIASKIKKRYEKPFFERVKIWLIYTASQLVGGVRKLLKRRF